MSETEQTQQTRDAEPRVHCLCLGIGPKVTAMLECGPQAARQHMRNARVEFLKAIRAVIDERIEHLSRTEKKGTTVAVE
jgi:hypothetical protein